MKRGAISRTVTVLKWITSVILEENPQWLHNNCHEDTAHACSKDQIQLSVSCINIVQHWFSETAHCTFKTQDYLKRFLDNEMRLCISLCSLQVCPTTVQVLLNKMLPKRALQGHAPDQGQEHLSVPPHPKLYPPHHHGHSQWDCIWQQGT